MQLAGGRNSPPNSMPSVLYPQYADVMWKWCRHFSDITRRCPSLWANSVVFTIEFWLEIRASRVMLATPWYHFWWCHFVACVRKAPKSELQPPLSTGSQVRLDGMIEIGKMAWWNPSPIWNSLQTILTLEREKKTWAIQSWIPCHLVWPSKTLNFIKKLLQLCSL